MTERRLTPDHYELPEATVEEVYRAAGQLDLQRKHFAGVTQMTDAQKALGHPFGPESAEALVHLATSLERAAMTFTAIATELRGSCGQRES